MEIAIIGGGITGLTTALALDKVGIRSTVYEQAEHINEIGAGIWLQPNAVKILRWLGVFEDIQKEGVPLRKMEITSSGLVPFKKLKAEIVSDERGNQTIAIHRGKLQQVLHGEVARRGGIELGMEYQSHTMVDGKPLMQFQSKKVNADVVIGADGIRSKVRDSIGFASEYRHSHQICCRGIARINLPSHLKNEGKEMWGSKRRFGFSQIARDKVYFFAVMNKEICPNKPNVETLAQFFRDFDSIVPEIIHATDQLHTSELTDLKRLKKWHNDYTCLLGDAAHATTPNMGQGACQGIEDAYFLSQALSTNQIPSTAAFGQFESGRRKKVDYVVNTSWQFGKMAHSAWGQTLLKGILRLTPERTLSKQMDKVFAVQGL
jgi:2-polyprenyl-6-methoxyphenol hydroxylase-like FAD-dependent oxidoreductase